MTRTLLDQDARDRIVNRHDENLFVDAGAGSGKTKQLVDRVVAMIVSGRLPSVRGLAAITFTENAAMELRTRIREALEASETATEAATGEATARDRCRAALGELDEAAITTLHGYARRLLADAPLEAGLPPGFRVHDDVRTSIDRDAWWRSLLDDWYADPALAQVWRVGLSLGLNPATLKEALAAFDANWDLLVDRPVDVRPLAEPDPDAVLAPLQRLLDYAQGKGPEGDSLTKRIDLQIAPMVRDARVEPDRCQSFAALCALNLAARGPATGQAAAWSSVGLDKQKACALLREAADIRDAQRTVLREAVTTTLVERLRVAVLEHAEQRRRTGELWFHDLLVYAVRLLREDAEVRAITRERWPVLCVDEFQDTDPLQVELVHLVAGLDDGAWEQAQVDGGRLFFVGDPKQSIYRFRRAEVQLFARVRDSYRAGCLGLTQNFRSRPGILGAVNAVFSDLLGADEVVGYQPLHAARDVTAPDPGPDVLLLGGPTDVGIGAVRETEAEHVAATLRRARGSWLVDVDGSRRPADYSDMAILVPTRTSLGQLEDALDRNDVPYRVMSRSLVWETDAVRDLVTVLQAIDDPADAVALVAALRHPMFACSDDDLVEWTAAGGQWNYERPQPEGAQGSPVAAAMDALRRYHELRWWLPVNVLLDRVVRERHAVELTAGHRRPRDHWRRLRFLVDQSRLFLDSGGTGLTAFVRWALEQIATAADAVETVVPERDDDAVQILTIHGCKGLEFPVVALTGINSPPQTRARVVWPADAAPAVTLDKEFKTPGFAEAHQAEKLLGHQEQLRLLYVGMTRAADHLVVSLHHKSRNGEANTHAMRLHRMLEILQGAGAVHEPDPPRAPDTAADVPPPRVPADCLAERERFLADRHRLLAEVAAHLPTTATGLVEAAEAAQAAQATEATATAETADASEAEAQEPADPLAALADEIPDARQVRPVLYGAATRGIALHRALELLDLTDVTAERIHLATAAACTEVAAPGLLEEVAERVRAAVTAPVLATAARHRHWKEVPIVATLDGRMVEGVVDLLVETDEGLVVVDYKTDAAATPAAVAAKVGHYTPQLRAYARAVTEAAGRPVVRALLLFCGPTAAHEVAVPAATAP